MRKKDLCAENLNGYRMSNIQAAIGLAQFENINSIVKLKREIGNMYNDKLKNLKYIKLQPKNFLCK